MPGEPATGEKLGCEGGVRPAPRGIGAGSALTKER